MEVLTYISYKKFFELYTEVYDLIVVYSCQTNLARRDIILM